MHGRESYYHRLSQATIRLAAEADMANSILCKQLDLVDASTPMPILSNCARGSEGRFLQISRNINGLDISEIDLVVGDTGKAITVSKVVSLSISLF